MSAVNQPALAPADAAAAEQILRVFGRLRSAAIGLRRRGDRASAAEIERIACDLVAGSAPVRASYASARLGISDPTLRKWVARSILEPACGHPLKVTLASLARADIEVRRARANTRMPGGRGMTDTVERHLQWKLVSESESFRRAMSELGDARPPDGHRSAERRSLALHRAIADRLDDESVAAARVRVRRRLKQGGPVTAARARQWDVILRGPLPQLRKAIVQDGEAMQDMRQDSPFAGVLSESERHRILREFS